MAVTLGAAALEPFERFSLYNSPYPSHDAGCAIDLYPGTGRGTGAPAPSPVAGVVREVETVRAPPKPYAPEHDHLILLDVEAPAGAAGTVARILHVDPGVEPGDRVDVGDPLGTLVRTGFFAPWVADHVHLGFRPPGRNLRRASGSLPIAVDVDPVGLAWDGTGTVTECADHYAVLDAPDPGTVHDDGAVGGDEETGDGVAAGDRWYGVAADGGGVLDGGLPHYEGGGLLGATDAADGERAVVLAGSRIGTRRGRTVEWDELAVRANGEPITGCSLTIARGDGVGVKLVWREPRTERFAVGSEVRVSVRAPE